MKEAIPEDLVADRRDESFRQLLLIDVCPVQGSKVVNPDTFDICHRQDAPGRVDPFDFGHNDAFIPGKVELEGLCIFSFPGEVQFVLDGIFKLQDHAAEIIEFAIGGVMIDKASQVFQDPQIKFNRSFDSRALDFDCNKLPRFEPRPVNLG